MEVGSATKRKGAGVFLPACVDRWIDEFGDDFGFQPLVKAEPTDYLPGSPEKVDEMRKRVRRGQPIFAKGDRAFFDGSSNAELEARAEQPKYTSWRGTDKQGIEQSQCGNFRYRYWRNWDASLLSVSFIGLSAKLEPNGLEDRKLKAIATNLECGGYQMLNLFARKVKTNTDLWGCEDSVGDANDRVIRLTVMATSFTVCCWGKNGENAGRASRIMWALSKTIPKESIFCFGVCKTESGFQPVSLASVSELTGIVKLPWSFINLKDEGFKR